MKSLLTQARPACRLDRCYEGSWDRGDAWKVQAVAGACADLQRAVVEKATASRGAGNAVQLQLSCEADRACPLREPPTTGKTAATTATIGCQPEALWFSAKPFMYDPAEVDDAAVIERFHRTLALGLGIHEGAAELLSQHGSTSTTSPAHTAIGAV